MPTGLGDEKLWLCPSLDDSADDISGNGNHGTYNGGMGTVADNASGGSRAYSFDGSNDYIDTTLTGIADLGSRSISAWCNFSTVSGIQYFMNWYDSIGGSDPRSLYLMIYQNTHWFGWKRNSASLKITGGTPATGWKHYCYVHDASAGTAKIYIDGTLVASGSILNTTFGNDYAEIGRVSIPSSTVYTQFKSDDIRIFDRALTTSEITHLATSRGIEGSPYTYSGLGDEKLWLCPSLDDSADDISGNGNHGTYNGGMGTVADTSNGGTRAYSFDGSNDYISLGNVLTGTSDFTISAWFNTDSTSFSYIYGKGISSSSGPNSAGIGIAQSSGGVYGAIGNGTSRLGLSVAGSVSASSWYHLCITFDRDGNATTYLDGVSVNSQSISSVQGNIGSSTDYIGRYGYAFGGFFDGLVDDVRTYERILSTSEITALASKRGYEVPAVSGSIPHALSSPFHPLG